MSVSSELTVQAISEINGRKRIEEEVKFLYEILLPNHSGKVVRAYIRDQEKEDHHVEQLKLY